MSPQIPDRNIAAAPLQTRDRLIVALDVSTAREAGELVRLIGDNAGLYKVGLQLYTNEGPTFVREMIASGRRVFLDLKLHDIPNTVGHAVKAARDLRVDMLTVHASGGRAMLQAAAENAGDVSLLVVTVLTSFTESDLNEVGVPGEVASQVMRMAKLATESGIRGVVSSPREASLLRNNLGEDFLIVTPGIRPAGTDVNDQQRIATPASALAAGASHLVVGRPITHAADPARAAREIVEEMTGAQAAV